MGKISEVVLQQWKNGETILSEDYTREREIIRVAINDNYDRLLQKYNKTEVDNLLNLLETKLTGQINTKANASDVYDKTENDSLLDTKADKEETYTKEETISQINGLIEVKADKEETYTKEETVAQIGILTGKASYIDGGSFTDVYSSQFEMINGGEF